MNSPLARWVIWRQNLEKDKPKSSDGKSLLKDNGIKAIDSLDSSDQGSSLSEEAKKEKVGLQKFKGEQKKLAKIIEFSR